MDWDGITDAGLRSLAPEAFEAFDAVAAQVDGAADPVIVGLARRHIGGLLGVAGYGFLPDSKTAALAGWPSAPGLTETERICVGLAEQFVLDVGSITSEQRAAFTDALGAVAFGYTQVLYAVDSNIRVRRALAQLFGAVSVAVAQPPHPDRTLWSALEEWMRVVSRMTALDTLTSELVRLRGARAHDCRVCKSRRHVVVVESGANEATFDQIDWYEASDLSERHKVALRLTDAMIWQPAAFPPELCAQVQATFSPEEAIEIVFDVSRNAANKIAVALGADQPNVTEGIEYFDTDERGRLILGLAPRATPA